VRWVTPSNHDDGAARRLHTHTHASRVSAQSSPGLIECRRARVGIQEREISRRGGEGGGGAGRRR
jgi:hypothetical protein